MELPPSGEWRIAGGEWRSVFSYSPFATSYSPCFSWPHRLQLHHAEREQHGHEFLEIENIVGKPAKPQQIEIGRNRDAGDRGGRECDRWPVAGRRRIERRRNRNAVEVDRPNVRRSGDRLAITSKREDK